MIRQALQHELAAILRSAVGLGGLLAFLVACGLAIFSGNQFRKEWVEALEVSEALESQAVEEVRGWYAAGLRGPKERPWVNLAQPGWQDWYAGTRLERLPSGLAGIAAGSIDDSPRVVRINRRTDPFQSEGAKIENPELGRSERLDLVFVFAVFLPLLVGVLGIGCGARERETGIVRLIAVQRGRASSWFLARAVAVTIVASVVALVGALANLLAAGAPVTEGIVLVGLSVLYTVLWSGLLTATAVAASNMREAAMAYGTAWLVLVVLLPAVLSEKALSTEAAHHGLEASLDRRAERYASLEKNVSSLLPFLYNAHPDLRTMPAAKQRTLPAQARGLIHDGFAALILVDRHREALSAEERAIRSAKRSMIWSPAVAYTMALESLAGLDLRSAMEFRSAAVDAVSARVRWALENAWRNRAMTEGDFESLIAASPKPVRPSGEGVMGNAVVLGVWALLAWALGVVRVRRAEVGE